MFLTAAVVAACSIGGAVVLALGTYLDDDEIHRPELRIDGDLVATGAPVIDARAKEGDT